MTARRDFLALAAGAVGATAAVPAMALPDGAPVGGIVPSDHPDADLLGWCRTLIEMEAEWCTIWNEDSPVPGYEVTVRAIERTPAKTDEGNRAKLAAAVAFFGPEGPEENALVSRVLWDAVRALALPPAGAPLAAVDPDADLILLSELHLTNLNAFIADGHDPDESNPLWVAYCASCDALSAARPQTIAGMVAKARVAKAEARRPNGEDDHENGPASGWAWDLLNDLLRLNDGAST